MADVHPLVTLFLAYCVVWSLRALFAFDTAAGQTIRDFPQPFGYVFLGALLVTAGFSIAGIIRRRTWYGILLEQAGQFGVGTLFLFYAIWAWSLFGERATSFGGILTFLGIGSILRAAQIEWIRRRGAKRGTP
jgi:hypothetical protein